MIKASWLWAFHFTGLVFGILIAKTEGWDRLFEFILSLAAMMKLYQFCESMDREERARRLM